MSDELTGRPDDSASKTLARAIRGMLRPLVRLLLEKQLGFPFLSNLLKGLYVEVAERDVSIPDRRPTDSRISLLTGIHRREVKRLREELRGEEEHIPTVLTLGALLVSRWIGEPEYLDAEGRPRALPRRAPAPVPSFESLVASVSRDLPPRSVLDVWLRLGVVSEDENGMLRLAVDSFVPEKGFEEKVHFFGRNLRDHIAAGAHNILEEGPPFFDRSVYYDRLSRTSAAELAQIAQEEGAELIRRVNRRAMELQGEDAERTEETTHRMTLGAYFYAVDERDESDDESS
jgi:hypothetical protein